MRSGDVCTLTGIRTRELRGGATIAYRQAGDEFEVISSELRAAFESLR
jgi:hypothetical protein